MHYKVGQNFFNFLSLKGILKTELHCQFAIRAHYYLIYAIHSFIHSLIFCEKNVYRILLTI